jgi:predicted AlkP superfamily pyrophosphatase or phosphodiesterase
MTLPDYDGGSILNLASSLAAHFGTKVEHAPLRTPMPLESVETVVLFIVDGFGQWQLEKHIADGDMPNLKGLLQSAQQQVITSVFPSTTMSAVTAIHTAEPPARTGWLGYTMWLEEVQGVVEMIGQVNLASKTRLEDRNFLKVVPSVYSKLEDVACIAVQPTEYRGTWLNEWYWTGATQSGYVSTNTAPSVSSRFFDNEGRKFITIYWADYDTVCHRHGPSSPEASDEISAVDHALGRLIKNLPKDGKTALIVTADHGQRDLQTSQAIYMDRNEELMSLLRNEPAGDRVCRTFRVKPGQLEAVAALLEDTCDLLPSSQAWEMGLFGGMPMLETFKTRVGDLIAMPRDGGQLIYTYPGKQPARPHRGSHGALSHWEMRVPLVTAKF